MNSLPLIEPNISNIDGIPTTDSLEFSLFFNKKHKTIVNIIDELCLLDKTTKNFDKMIFLVDTDKHYIIYQMTLEGFIQVCNKMGHLPSSLKRTYIICFNKYKELTKSIMPFD